MSDHRDETTGRFLPGNRFWEARSSHGRNPIFADPDDLWDACCEYFAWNADNPLYEDNLVTFQGSATHEPTAKMRAMTIAGLCMFLDVSEDAWRLWKKERTDFIGVITRAESVIYRQKFEGASANMLNPNIIARDLGLADKKEHSSPDGTMTPPTTIRIVAAE
ncbi:DNA-packaging protein [Sphingobium yanoikuyae]|uniref:DNA-packaging protein n=1 Tax=Sphingobium yanoikuyae TaxID=13690 RepID=UPI003B8F8107